MTPKLYLASQSPRRRELLQQIGISFATISVTVCEDVLSDESPQNYVTRLAKAKAEAGWNTAVRKLDIPVLGADTSVVVDDQILGKPIDAENAKSMLQMLSGKEHQVFSAIALVYAGKVHSALSTSRVIFRNITPAEIAAYCLSGEPLDKAGAYAIQGKAAVFIKKIEGSYSGVIGLPLFELQQLLKQVSIDVL